MSSLIVSLIYQENIKPLLPNEVKSHGMQVIYHTVIVIVY